MFVHRASLLRQTARFAAGVISFNCVFALNALLLRVLSVKIRIAAICAEVQRGAAATAASHQHRPSFNRSASDRDKNSRRQFQLSQVKPFAIDWSARLFAPCIVLRFVPPRCRAAIGFALYARARAVLEFRRDSKIRIVELLLLKDRMRVTHRAERESHRS